MLLLNCVSANSTSKIDVIINKNTPEGVNARCVGVSKNYPYVEWQ